MNRQQRRAQQGKGSTPDIRLPLTQAGNLFNIMESDIVLAKGCAALSTFFINLPEMARQGTPTQVEMLKAQIEHDAEIINAYAESTESLEGGETLVVDARIPLAMLRQTSCARNYFQVIQNDYPQAEAPFTALAAEKGVTQSAVIELHNKLTAMARAASPYAGQPA